MVPTALLQRRLPNVAAQRYVKYLPTVRYGTYGSTGKGPKLPRERLPLYPGRVYSSVGMKSCGLSLRLKLESGRIHI